MSSLQQQFQSVKNAIRRQQHRTSETQKIRTINTIKWKQSMLQALHHLATHPKHDRHLLEELKTVVTRIPEERFIEAIINLQPFKPHFDLPRLVEAPIHNRKSSNIHKFELSPKKEGLDEATTSSGSILKRSELEELSAAKKLKGKQRLMAMLIQEEVLAKEISSPQHPFAKISQAFSLIMENKYKDLIDGQIRTNKLMRLQDFMEKLGEDLHLISEFFKMVSEPMIDIFDVKEDRRACFAEQIHSFIRDSLRNSERVCSSMRKIMRYYVKHSSQLRHFELNCPIQAQIQNYDIPPHLQIEGCFIYTTAELISFSNDTKAKDLLARLTAIRTAVYRDIDEYYSNSIKGSVKGNQPPMEASLPPMEVSSAVQLEILKFCLVKLRIFAGEILSGMSLVSALQGEAEMAFHFDEASYIHSQLTIAFAAVQHNL